MVWSKRQKFHFLCRESNSGLQGLSSYIGIVQDNGVILHWKFSFTDRLMCVQAGVSPRSEQNASAPSRLLEANDRNR
jgi:hypothetical protein